jgi:branched-chain amino acid transport system substrate-binding protein
MGAFAKASATHKVSSAIAATLLLGASVFAISGCTASAAAIDCETFAAPEAGGTGTSTAEATGNTIPDGSDIELKIGTALPQTGNLAFLGPPEEAGVALAVKEVNSADKGISIDAVWGDSGDTDNKAYETEIPRLLDAGVSAILGAASSGTSLQFIDQVTGAGVIQFSPANTSAALSNYADNGLYFRTAPSDVLQGEVLGNLIAADGIETLGMVVLNDSYGTGLARFTCEAFTAAGGKVVAAPLYNTGDTSFDAQISAVTAAAPDAIVLITFEEVKTIAPELIGGGFPADKVYFVDGNLANYSEDFEAGLLTGAKGTLPGLDISTIADFTKRMNDNWVAEGNADLAEVYAYGPEAYDAVVLIALASLEARSIEGADIATKLQEVSGGVEGGTKCTSFAECADIIIGGGQADYDGVSGPITFDDNGDPTEAEIGIYQYGEDNVAVPFKG